MLQQDKILRMVEIAEAKIGLRRDGIIHVYYKDNTEVNVDLQYKLLELFKVLSDGNDHPFIYEGGDHVTVTKDARDNATKLEREAPQTCSAVYVSKLAYKLIAEFYYKFNKPKKPYKVFRDFQAGIDWLHKTHEELVAVKV